MQNTWHASDDLTKFLINKSSLKESLISRDYQSSTDLCCFSHVPKTAGTSLESIVAKNFKISDVLHVNAPDLSRMPNVFKLKKKPPKFICGHHPIHSLLYQLIDQMPLFHFTQLRNPVDRVLSYYNYIKGRKEHPLHSHASDKSLEQFISSCPSPELSNGQARRFSGFLHTNITDDNSCFLAAQETLTECFSLVMTTCLFDESLLMLKTRLGLSDLYYSPANVSKKFTDKTSMNDATFNMIMENNQADIQLYKWAKDQFLKLIDKELSTTEINTFKSNNQKWRNLMAPL